MSPELFKMDSNITDIENRKLDIWALGILAYELFFGKRPFEAFSLDELSQMFEKGNYQIDLSLTKEEKISKEFFIFLTKCLQKDPINRANILELKNSDFLNLNIDFLEKMNSIEFENFLKDSAKIRKKDDKTIFIININEDYSKILGLMEHNCISYFLKKEIVSLIMKLGNLIPYLSFIIILILFLSDEKPNIFNISKI
jgi:serine/threonine protein kinase